MDETPKKAVRVNLSIPFVLLVWLGFVYLTITVARCAWGP